MPIRTAKSPCDRAVPKPEKPVHTDRLAAENENAVEEEIEVYKDKIAIADEILKIHKKEEEESRLGADEQMKHMQRELIRLRKDLRDALVLEKTIVRKALKFVRSFQLAVDRRNAIDTLGWLEDRWFDQRKKLDELLSVIYGSRKELADSESMIMAIEHCPRPGSLAWEKVCKARIVSLELMIQSMLVKKETVEILLARYTEIKEIITQESGSYDKMLTDSGNEMLYQKSELKRMQDAHDFSEEQVKLETLEMKIAQKEAANGHLERKQITNAKKELMDKKKPPKKGSTASRKIKLPYEQTSKIKHGSEEMEEIRRRIMDKLKMIERYEAITECLTGITHVRSIHDVPERFVFLLRMRKRLADEKVMKSELLNVMLRQKEQLHMILEHFKNNGDNKRKMGNKKLEEIRKEIAKVKANLVKKERQVKQGANLACEAKLGAISLLTRIRDCHRNGNIKPHSTDTTTTRGKSPTTLSRISQFTIEELGRRCGDEGEIVIEYYDNEHKRFSSPDDPDLQAILAEEEDKPVVSERLIRVDSLAELRDNNYMDVEYMGSKVPDRSDIKEQNKKYITDAIYKRDVGQC